jgi:hypothetical protein
MVMERCGGGIANLVHETHTVRFTAGVLWCVQCGAYATRQPRRLAEPCGRRPATEAQRNVLQRLSAGKAPTTARYLEEVATANNGVRGSAESHTDEVRWRRGEGDNGLLTRVTQHGGRAVGRQCQIAAAPTGRYARLRGGALHRGGDEGMTIRADSESHIVRAVPDVSERIRRQPVPGAVVAERGDHICSPSATAGWTRRLCITTTACAKACNICSEPTRSKCKGCDFPVCLKCARDGRHCKADSSRIAEMRSAPT